MSIIEIKMHLFLIDDENRIVSNCPQIIGRKRWGSRTAKSITYQTIPVKYVIVHHTVTPSCETKLKCSNILIGIQNYHMDEQGGEDIPYNFLVSDNDIYEGTGWHIRGGHTYNYNSNSTGIAFIGSFNEKMPTAVAIQKTKQLLKCGVESGELHPNYILLGGRQIYATESPGLELYADLQDWEHWSSTL
ncbi:peptidoglycan-recognition protein SA-like isoform X2 [Sitodiplosis mosellana]|uniref:peptidoglycan-recognition protein SA-like isoform X2 n=1 Tax=Sitodiplosis mosellana TaxID=263140 RepID=UPI002444525C|nr:peptidoglycan-recognition protein SA-like isoform X2 [Sitodiplosis mosellana]